MNDSGNGMNRGRDGTQIDIAALEDDAEVSVGDRFRAFSLEAAEVLATRRGGDWLLEPGKHKAKFTLSVTVTMDDVGAFDVAHETKVTLPRVPTRAVRAKVVAGVGLVQLDLFGAQEGRGEAQAKPPKRGGKDAA